MGKKADKYKDAVRKQIISESKPLETIDSRTSRQIVIFADGADQKQLIRAEAKRRGISMSRFILDTMKKEVLGVE